MKKFPVLLFLPLLILTGAAAPVGQYEAAMQSAMEKLFQAQNPEQLQEAANAFQRIGQKETDKWHPRYYEAYARIMMSLQMESPGDKDKQLDLALELVTAADALSPKNSELATLEGFIHMLRIPIDPASRGPQYSGMSMGALQKAIALNPENPRAYLLLANMQFGTARFFGSDNSEGCATLKKALALFGTAQPATPLDPAWGKEWGQQTMQQCP